MSGAKLNASMISATVMKLQTCVQQNMSPDELDRSGAILYSTQDTLKSHWLLIVGTNPGGSVTVHRDPEFAIKNHIIAKMPELVNTDWRKNGKLTPLQNRIKLVVESWLDGGRIENVPYTNLIFMRTQSMATIDWNWAERCWPVNEFLLDSIQPSLILTIGNGRASSSYAFLSRKLEADNHSSVNAGFGRYVLKSAIGHYHDRDITLLGLPHLSRYPIASYEHKVREWIATQVQNARFN